MSPFSKRFLVVVLIIKINSRFVIADDDFGDAVSALQAANNRPWSRMSAKILDPDGKALKGAKIRPWALRAGAGHYWWDQKNFGAPKTTLTADDGTAEIEYPATVNRTQDDGPPVVEVSVMVTHPDFCSKSAHFRTPIPESPDIPELTLTSGFRLRIAGVRPGDDRPLPYCRVMLEDSFSNDEFTRGADGWLLSVPIQQDRRWFRVIYAPPGELPQFSKLQAWTKEDAASREVRMEVRPGVRVRGKIDDSVERPIRRGRVMAVCGSPVRADAARGGDHQRSIMWSDTVPIAADGTFEFSSLPAGHLAQLYAFANDSISAQPSDKAYEICCKWFSMNDRPAHKGLRYGQILRLAGDVSEFTMEMEPTGEILVTCVNENGVPLQGISVATWPNQYMVGAGSTVFCVWWSSLDELIGKPASDWARDTPFRAETNSQGQALITNLPAGQHPIRAAHEFWRNKDEAQAASEPGKTTELKITLQRKQ